jgi:ectoine hydroxylase-related dioxygenase (phytanoyl-CoA dioxygenase family)
MMAGMNAPHTLAVSPASSSTAAAAERVTDAHLAQFHRDGFFVLEGAMPPAQLAALQSECGRFIAERDAEMEAQGIAVDGITHKGRRYFLARNFAKSAVCHEWLYGDLMAEVTRKTLGPEVQLFLDQFVVKGPEVGMKFGWHQDGGYVGYPHAPYLSCWVALDDMCEANGTISVLPYDRAGGTAIRAHLAEQGTNDKIGYHGDDPGDLVIIPAGSVVVFSSQTFHKSGVNTTPALRRAYLCQYTAEPMYKPDGTLQICAEPFLVGGRNVAQR